MTAPPLAYRLASTALALPLAGYTVTRALRDGGGTYLRQRYGLGLDGPGLDGAAAPVWMHCASVGEVAAAAPLLRALAAAGIGPLLVSTSTPTGRNHARTHAPAEAALVYLPLDRPATVRRFLDHLQPRAAIILETELWPHLFAGLAARDVPIVLVNGRLSPRTLEAPAWWRATAAWCLQRVTRVLARSEEDRQRFVAVGADPAQVEALGNLKFAAPPAGPAEPIGLGRPFVLAASTHDDEELQLARAWRDGGPADRLLAIAPRHPERGAAIARALEGDGLAVRRRSRGETPGDASSIYLADTLGELTGLIAGADVVVMGGSLIPHGGQNVLEPARAGRAIVTGPHMHNFTDETARLERAGALVRRDDAAAVIATVRDLLAAPERRRAMGRQGRQLIEAEADMAERYRRALVAAVPAIGGERRSDSG